MKLSKVFLAVLLVFVLVGTACAEDTIKIGVYNSLTGRTAFGGQLELEGIQMAHQEVPELLGKKVELIVVDNKTDKVVAVIGTYGSSLAMAGGEVAEAAKIPMMGTSCTNPLVTQGKMYVFRACFIDPYQGAGAATYAMKTLNMKKAALLIDVANDYSVGLATFFKQSFKKLGGEIVSELKYNSGDQDFTAQLTEIISKKPELLFIPADFAEGAIIMKQARELGAEFQIMGGDAMDNPELVKIGGDAVNGFIHTTFPYDATMKDMSPLAATFTENWKKIHPDKAPNVNAALGYDSYMLVANAIKTAGSAEPDAIRAALAQTKDFPGVTGNKTINATHDAESPVGIIQIKDGQRVYVGEVSPEM